MRYIFIFLLATVFIAFSPQQKSQTVNVLFVGNSYTFFNNLPQICSGIAASMGDVMIAEQATVGGYRFKQHLVDSSTLKKIIAGPVNYSDWEIRKDWDFVVLQEHSQAPSNSPAEVQKEVFPYARSLDSIIHKYNRTTRTIFFRTWGRKNGKCNTGDPTCSYSGMDSVLALNYGLMGRENHALISPVGDVWKLIRTAYPEIELYHSDQSHPSEAGSYAAAVTFYTILFKKDPTDIKFNYSLDPETASKIRKAVKKVAFNRLAEWYRYDTQHREIK